MRRIRIIGLSLLALGVPAFAFGGEQAPPVGNLSVSASLGGCGLAGNAIVCQIDASWNQLEGAEYYTVSVTRADGSVVDLGQSAGSSRSVFVPYVGPGTYSVQVAAWGTPPGAEDPQVLAREKSLSTAGNEDANVTARSHGAARPEPDRGNDPAEEEPTGPDDPAIVEPPAVEPPAVEPPPACEAEPPDEEQPEEPAEPAQPPAEASAQAEAADAATQAADAEEDDPDLPACP